MGMQVSELKNEGLVREYKVVVMAADLEAAMTSRLTEVGRTAKLDGFRPGKAPLPVLRQLYGPSVRYEIVDQTINQSADKALNEKGLRAAVQPKIENVKADEGTDLEFTMRVEIFPEIKPVDFSTLQLEKLAAEVADEKVTEGITRITKARRGPEYITEARPAKEGDVLVIDFEGESEGKAHDGMKGNNHRLELGSKAFIDGFETQLIGAKKGDERSVKVTFPADYPSEALAGKPAIFKVNVKDIMMFEPIVQNDELAKELGFDNLEDLRGKVKEQMNADLSEMSGEYLKRQLLDKLADTHEFPVPPALLEQEFNGIWAQIEAAKKKGQTDVTDRGKSEDDLKVEYRGIAERRVRLGLLLSEVGRLNKLGVNEQELRTALMQEAARYPGQEKAVYEFYRKTPGALQRLEAPILEQKVVSFILEKAAVSERKVKTEELEAALKEPEKRSTKKKTKP